MNAMTQFLIIVAVLNILSFCLFGLDAFFLASERKPVPRVLLILSVIFGGGFGALCAMILLKHLFKDSTFRVLVPVFAILQVVVSALICAFIL